MTYVLINIDQISGLFWPLRIRLVLYTKAEAVFLPFLEVSPTVFHTSTNTCLALNSKSIVTRNRVGREASNHGHCRVSMGSWRLTVIYVPLNMPFLRKKEKTSSVSAYNIRINRRLLFQQTTRGKYVPLNYNCDIFMKMWCQANSPKNPRTTRFFEKKEPFLIGKTCKIITPVLQIN